LGPPIADTKPAYLRLARTAIAKESILWHLSGPICNRLQFRLLQMCWRSRLMGFPPGKCVFLVQMALFHWVPERI